MIEELKPCPFCGGEAELSDLGDPTDDSFVNCTKCSVQQIADHSPKSAIAAWNTRTDPDKRLREALERVDELEKDRARYQWLANAVLACDYGDNEMGGADSPDRIGWSVQLTRRNAEPFIFGQSIDAAIDAALSHKEYE